MTRKLKPHHCSLSHSTSSKDKGYPPRSRAHKKTTSSLVGSDQFCSVVCNYIRMKFQSIFLFLATVGQAAGFNARPQGRQYTSLKSATMADLTFQNPDTTGIEEQACVDAAQRMERVAVPVSPEISPSGSVGISYIHWPAQKPKRSSVPLVLIHGFDSSALEYRRLGPRLAADGIDTYAVDILGWGYTQLDDVASFSADSKVAALKSFVESKFGENGKICIAGASLGGAAAIELAAAKGDDCAGLILIDAQGFVDGVGPMAALPKPLAKLGVGVLRSVPLRNSANQMSYFDKETFATEEAQVIGRLHCLREGWTDAMVSFMLSGGFSPSTKIPAITAPSLVLWGRQDGILDGNEYANKVCKLKKLE
jgi:pimeloyl-ACP methyl ester carboxylesterase